QESVVILLVEDEVLIRFNLADFLRHRGFTVLEAATVDEAVAIFGAGVAVNLVFSDIHFLGPHSGVELGLWIGSYFPEGPVMLTSGVHSALQAAEAACPNVSIFVGKPYDYAALEWQMRMLLARHSVGLP